ncbi:ferritin-like domain-containing protein [Hydrogenophaga sp. 5NK40-0174]
MPDPNLRKRALAALCESDPSAKVGAVHAIFKLLEELRHDDSLLLTALNTGLVLHPLPELTLPGRPARPVLVPPGQVPHRSPFTDEGLAALLHAICHIEFNAINLALDAVWRFEGMPEKFYTDWLRVADEEATHFSLLRELLLALGHEYGDFEAHNGLWEMCVKTKDDIVARMALVPRTLEARGLDATPLIQAKLRKVNSEAASKANTILDIILRDEVGHVAIGNYWYAWLCHREGFDPVPHYRVLARRHEAPRLKPPFNEEARKAAGFTQAELDFLLGA